MGKFVELLIQAEMPAAPSSDTSNMLGWFTAGILAVVVVVIIVRPLLVTERAKTPQILTESPLQVRLEGLQESAQAEQKALDELEFDHELGSLEETDYTALKEKSARRLSSLNTQIATIQTNLGQPVQVAAPVVVAPVRSDTEKFRFRQMLKEKMKCGECGTPFKPGDHFCQKCQAPLPVFCQRCGNEITEDDRFCAKCGAAVNT